MLRKDMQEVKNQVLDVRKKRLKILGDDEIDALYGRPRFICEERAQYFSLSLAEKTVLVELHSTKSKIFFLLQLGYFKARQMFFVFSSSEVEEDIKYIQGFFCPKPQNFRRHPSKHYYPLV